MFKHQRHRPAFIASLLLMALVLTTGISSAIKKRPLACVDEVEDIRTQLRLRTAELQVAHGQLGALRKKLKACGASTEE